MGIYSKIAEREGFETADMLRGAAYNVVHKHMRQFPWYDAAFDAIQHESDTLIQVALSSLYEAYLNGETEDFKVRAMKAITEETRPRYGRVSGGRQVKVVLGSAPPNVEFAGASTAESLLDYLSEPKPSAEREYFNNVTHSEAGPRYDQLMRALVKVCSENELEAVQAYANRGTLEAAGQALGRSRDSVWTAIKRVRRKLVKNEVIAV